MDTSVVTRGLGNAKLFLGKHSPEILLATGIISGITAAYFAVKVKEQAKAAVEDLKTQTAEALAKEVTEEYTEADKQREVGTTAIRGTLEVARIVFPVVGFGVLSITSLMASHGIMNRRLASMTTAYSMAVESLAAYRARFAEEYGPDAESKLNKETITVKRTNEETGEEEEVVVQDPFTPSIYARFFDNESSVEFKESFEHNLSYLKTMERYMNEKLRLKGYLFLNDVYDALGMKQTSEGQLVGWLYKFDPKKGNDGYVSFDIDGSYNVSNANELRRTNPRFLLDFNVDGVMYNLI